MIFPNRCSPHSFHALSCSVLAIALLIGCIRLWLYAPSDPHRCAALQTKGSWLDQTHHIWQPDGCTLLHTYKSEDTFHCLTSRQVIFIGDSTTRQLFYHFSHLIDNLLPTGPANDGAKHRDVFLRTQRSTQLTFYWDPYLNETRTRQWLGVQELPDDGWPRRRTRRPALIVIGSGLWYLRYAEGGPTSWKANTESILGFTSSNFSAPAPADEVVILPVPLVVASLLSPERANAIHTSDIEAMNLELFHRVYPQASISASSSIDFAQALPISFPMVFNEMLDSRETSDGLHYSDAITKAQASLLLNLHCNEHRTKAAPLATTCCTSYPSPSFLHLMVLAVVILWGPINWYRVRHSALGERLRVDNTAAPLVISSVGALLYLADRTYFWLKEHKHFDPWSFALLSLLGLAVSLCTMKQSDKDTRFLDRGQTDEWKGWMQVLILLYHYLDASKISGLYNPVRVLVASYLFMTGYGHTIYYYVREDYSFWRVAQVLVRLNLLTVMLCYTMNTSYLSYYFAPLVSMWFIVLFFTMYIGAGYNHHLWFIALKIVLSAACTSLFVSSDKPMRGVFGVLEAVAATRWNAHEWVFRTKLDVFILYVGMLTAILVLKAQERKLLEEPQWSRASKLANVLSVTGLTWFFIFELGQPNKFAYNKWHPYISFIPILSFVILRNSTPYLRSMSSTAFAWIGTCSLETYILQYHLWLAGDSKVVLLMLPGTRWRPVNFVLTSIVLLSLSKLVATATGEVTKAVCGPQPDSSRNASSNRRAKGSWSQFDEETALLREELDTPRADATTWKERVASGGLWVVDGMVRATVDVAEWVGGLDWRTYGVKARMCTILLILWVLNLCWT